MNWDADQTKPENYGTINSETDAWRELKMPKPPHYLKLQTHFKF